MIGKKAPHFSCEAVVNGITKTVSLDDFAGKYKILFFYPLDFTFVCPTEMHALQEKLEAFTKRNVEVLAISVDSVHSHRAWLKTPQSKGGIEGVTYPVLSDITKTIARDYGVLKEDEGVALRGVFLIDTHDMIQYAAIHNLPLGRNVHEIIRVVDALQHVEENGVVCPANWVPGGKTMTPNAEGLQDYFG